MKELVSEGVVTPLQCTNGHIFNKQGMSVDPAKVKLIKDWKRPKDKAGVKSFLQTAAFCQVFMKPGAGRTYTDVTLPQNQLGSSGWQNAKTVSRS